MNQKTYFWAFIACLLSLAATACANESNKNEPGTDCRQINIISQRYLPLLETLNNYVDEKKINGGVALVYEKGEIVLHQPFGFRNTQKQIPFRVDDIFRLASMTKPVTSVAAMMLYEQGKFKLDDPIEKYLPDFSNPKILTGINPKDTSFTHRDAEGIMTIRQLFTYTSGMYYGFDNDSLASLFAKNGISEGFEKRAITLEENTRRLSKLPLLHEPGERYHYGMEMDILGRLIEVWSGMDLESFFKEMIFDRLGMHDTYFWLPENKYNRLAPVYMSRHTSLSPSNYDQIDYPVSGAKTYLSGGAGLSGTAWDYGLFCLMILNQGKVNNETFLRKETVELMTQTHLETGDSDMGLGLSVLSSRTYTDMARGIGSVSWGGFFATNFWVDPENEIIAILLLQIYPFEHWEIQKVFEDTIYTILNKP